MTRRLLAYMVVAALASSALTVAVAAVLSNRSLVNDRIDALEARAGDVEANLAARDAPRRDRLRVFVVGPRGGVTQSPPRSMPRVAAAVAVKPAGSGELKVGKRNLLYVRRDTDSGPIALIRQRGKLAGDASPVGGVLLIAGLGGAIVAALLAALLARRFLKPIRELTTATTALAAGDGNVRVEAYGDDELGVLAQSFNHMAADLNHARDAERRFVHAVSHELRTPLTAIAGYAEGLDDGALTSAEAAPVLKAETARLERLVADLLELAAIGASGFAVKREPVDLGHVVAAVRDRFAPRAVSAGVTLTATGSGTASGDSDRLVQAVANLVDNALRVTPQGGRITIAAAPGRSPSTTPVRV